jgi:hypothetical protein
MAATITVEDGTGKSDANSYISLADANLYFETHPQATAWNAATDDNKNRLLITAARILDNCVNFNGYKINAIQALQWPREEARDPDSSGGGIQHIAGSPVSDGYFASNAVPKGIKDAQCELARFILAEDRTADAPGTGIREFELTGTLKVAYESGNPAKLRQILPEYVRNMLNRFGVAIGGLSGCVKLGRA